jgi:phosphoribosylformimino-5-aminoimidazole carboxamide ribotide isomerase
MQVIPSIDVAGGRSRVVFWPGVSAGVGAPTDRPERIAERFVELGARVIHVVDFDGARAGRPANLDAVGAIASRVAVPIQLAGGLEAADHVRLAFAAGATRVVLAMSVADDQPLLADCLGVAGEWLAVGLDPRPERLAAFPWRRTAAPASVEVLVDELVARGVARFVLSHGGVEPDTALLARLARATAADFLVAGGVSDLDGVRRLRDAGVAGIILGEALLSGAVDFTQALEAAA